MKTAISIPDQLYHKADRLAAKMQLSRSRLYVIAIERFVKEHQKEKITQDINDYIDLHGQPTDDVFTEGTLSDLKKVEW
jgi:metal-responsive CopG/Arc/MetJ family transcriptional regulator